ncbi:hypothetical protein EV426DRAFT_206765 [Tirmania nivea]|nr:hypothetical protein EV426DRAFT_206765 [Tirmania nivea]
MFECTQKRSVISVMLLALLMLNLCPEAKRLDLGFKQKIKICLNFFAQVLVIRQIGRILKLLASCKSQVLYMSRLCLGSMGTKVSSLNS